MTIEASQFYIQVRELADFMHFTLIIVLPN